MAERTLREMLETEQLFVPCVYDCMSARAAELSGYPAIFLSGGAIAYSQNGLPDMAFSTADEMIAIVERITACTKLPLLVDADDGYGESPIVVYHTVKRLIKAGAQAFCLDDATAYRGFERRLAAKEAGEVLEKQCISREAWLAKIKASVRACTGTDCMVIARTEVPDLDEAIERCIRARKLGADMTLICGPMKNLEDGKKVSRFDPGLKMWPDVFSVNGVMNVELEDIRKLGFRLVTFHVFEKAALYGMMIYGTENRRNGNTVYSDCHDRNGTVTEEELERAFFFHRDMWMSKEQ